MHCLLLHRVLSLTCLFLLISCKLVVSIRIEYALPFPNASLASEAAAVPCFRNLSRLAIPHYCTLQAEKYYSMSFARAATFKLSSLPTADNATKKEAVRICNGYWYVLNCTNGEDCKQCSYRGALDMSAYEVNTLRWINQKWCSPAGKNVTVRPWCQENLPDPPMTTTAGSMGTASLVCCILVTVTLFLVICVFAIYWAAKKYLHDEQQLTDGELPTIQKEDNDAKEKTPKIAEREQSSKAPMKDNSTSNKEKHKMSPSTGAPKRGVLGGKSSFGKASYSKAKSKNAKSSSVSASKSRAKSSPGGKLLAKSRAKSSSSKKTRSARGKSSSMASQLKGPSRLAKSVVAVDSKLTGKVDLACSKSKA